MTTKMETRIQSGAQHYQWPWALTIIFILCSLPLISTEETYAEFAPHVAATCKAGTMNIKVNFNSPYVGIVHARGYRNSSCVAFGNGTTSVGLSLNLLASQSQNDYCGTLVSNVNNERTEERSIQLAVRVHKTLELADDKFYVITCGKTSFTRDENSQVILKFFEDNRRVRETVYGRPYTIRAEITHPNISNHIHVKNCFAFGKKNTSFHLIDNRGCPIDSKIISKFVQEENKSSAVAVLQTMFKFPEGSEVHLQCDIVQCTNNCPDQNICSNTSLDTKSRSITEIEEPIILAATTVFVIDPADAAVTAPLCDETGIHPSWLLWLTIALGILFLIMLLMNIFLCTAMSCSCARTEIIEKEPSIIEEYDPYRSWHGSQYGSRYSLHARDGHNKGYTSGGSTIHSNRSLPIESDHYAIVHSRPGSRHSGINGYRRRGPPSNL